MRWRSRFQLSVVAVSAFVAASVAGAAQGLAQPVAAPRATDDACPADVVPEDGFGDVAPGNVHEAAVDCAVLWGVARGHTASIYEPQEPVTRAAMASFIARLVNQAGGTLPAAPPDAFTDDDGDTHESNINALAAAGLVQGTGPGTYAPAVPVTRGQMASFLAQAYEHLNGSPLPETGDYFSDDNTSTPSRTSTGPPEPASRPASAGPRTNPTVPSRAARWPLSSYAF